MVSVIVGSAFKKMVVDLTSKQSGLRSDCDIACDTSMDEDDRETTCRLFQTTLQETHSV